MIARHQTSDMSNRIKLTKEQADIAIEATQEYQAKIQQLEAAQSESKQRLNSKIEVIREMVGAPEDYALVIEEGSAAFVPPGALDDD